MQPIFFFLAFQANDLMASAMQIVFVILFSFAAIAIGYSSCRFFVIYQQAEARVLNDPGCATEQALLLLLLARRIGKGQRQFSSFCAALLEITTENGPPSGASHARLIELLQKNIRSTSDAVCLYRPGVYGLIIEADPETRSEVLERVRALAAQSTAEGPLRQRCGCSVFPLHGTHSTALLKRAEEQLQQAEWDGPPAFPESESKKTWIEEEAEEEESIRKIRKGLLDELTGVLSPQKVAGFFRKFIAQQSRKTPMVFLYAGLEELDEVTELYGPEAAEALRKAFSDVLQQNLRAEDLIGRYNEDAFLVLLLCDAEPARSIALRLRDTMLTHPLEWNGRRLNARVNIGVSMAPEHGRGLPPLFKAAEAAYRKAAARGGSMCEVCET